MKALFEKQPQLARANAAKALDDLGAPFSPVVPA
ncbi:hypothetical protein JOF41_006845 [Saccharothrix coeruleofusca]|nr:hypothetical protein [Saccharothrix coeruleofusca]